MKMNLNRNELKRFAARNFLFDFSRRETQVLFGTAFFILLTYTFFAITRPDLDIMSDGYLYTSVLSVGSIFIYMIVSGFLVYLTSSRNRKSLE